MSKPFSRKGLQRLECAMCAETAYHTVAQLERYGLPACWCGDRFQPTSLELAFILDAVDSRPFVEYERECNSVARGQASHGVVAGREGRDLARTPEQVAAERVERSRRDSARARRLALFAPTVEPMAF